MPTDRVCSIVYRSSVGLLYKLHNELNRTLLAGIILWPSHGTSFPNALEINEISKTTLCYKYRVVYGIDESVVLRLGRRSDSVIANVHRATR